MTDRPYRVLVFAMVFPPVGVGSGTYAYRLARGLVEKGVEVLVLAPEDGQGRWVEFDMEQPYRTVRMPFEGNVLMGYWKAWKWLRRTLREFQPDCVWTTNGMATRVAGLPGGPDGRGVPLVSCMRGSDIVTRLPGKGIWARLESIPQRRCYRNSVKIAAASQYLKKVAMGKGVDGEKIFFNPSAFDFSLIDDFRADNERLYRRYPSLKGRPMVLSVGRLVEQKRMHILIQAMHKVVEQVPEVCCVIAGEGKERNRLEGMIGEFGLKRHLLLTGGLPPMSEELFDLYGAADLFAMLGVREGLSNVFLEAGAFKLPAVGVSDGGVPEVIRDGETGLLAPADDVETVAERIIRLLLAPEKAAAMGERAREWIEERFSSGALVERSYRALVEIAGGRL